MPPVKDIDLFDRPMLLFVAALSMQAPDTVRPYEHSAAPTVRAVRIAGGIRIDGRLDEAPWAQAVPAANFNQLDPDEGRPASESTEVRVLISDDALYIGARLYDSDRRGTPCGTPRRGRDAETGGEDSLGEFPAAAGSRRAPRSSGE